MGKLMAPELWQCYQRMTIDFRKNDMKSSVLFHCICLPVVGYLIAGVAWRVVVSLNFALHVRSTGVFPVVLRHKYWYIM